jgi:hypothetical protein
MRVYNVILFDDQPMDASFASEPMSLNQMFGYSIQAVWVGAPNGIIKLQCSVDSNSGNINPTNWTDIANSPQTITVSGDFTWNVTYSMYNWVRVVYTDLSGGTSAAVLNMCTFNGKGN